MGIAKDLSMARRAQLAVVAHIRHTHTDYDRLLRQVSWQSARFAVGPECITIMTTWRGEDEPTVPEFEEVFQEVILLDSDDEDGLLAETDLCKNAGRIRPDNERRVDDTVQDRSLATSSSRHITDTDTILAATKPMMQPARSRAWAEKYYAEGTTSSGNDTDNDRRRKRSAVENFPTSDPRKRTRVGSGDLDIGMGFV